MKDRGMKKWRPFNAVASRSELLKYPSSNEFPSLSKEQIQEFEEILKESLYTHSKVHISFIEDGSKKAIDDYVEKLDGVKKDVILKSRKINFRQIYSVKK